MSVQGVNFRGDEQQQKQSSGILFPALGTAAGAGVTYLSPFGKTPVVLEELTADKFEKATKDVPLEGADKTAATTIKDYLTKLEAETKPETDTKASETEKTAQNPEVTKSEAAQKYEATVKKFFGEKGTEIPTRQLLGGESIENYKKGINNVTVKKVEGQAQKVADKNTEIQEANERLERAQANYKDELEMKDVVKTDAAIAAEPQLKADLEEAKTKLNTAKEKYNKAKNLLPENDIAAAKAELDAKQAVVDNLNDSIATAHEKAIIKADKAVEKAANETEAANKKLNEAKEELKKAKSEVEIKEKEAKVKTAEKELATKTNLLKEAKAIAEDKKITDQAIRQAAAENRIVKVKAEKVALEAQLKTENETFSKLSEELATKKAYLSLAEQAGENGKVAKSTFVEKTSNGIKVEMQAIADKAGIKTEAASKLPESVKTAWESIKSKLKPTEMSGKKVALGAGIGLAAGLLIKLMADGSNKKEA